VGKALEGVRVLDMTHVQSGASCAQILAWMGADVVKLEAPGGDITRKPLRDIPDVDSFDVTVLRLPDQTVRLPGRRPTLTPAGRHKLRTSTVANSVATTNSPASRRRGSSDESPQQQTEQAKGYRERNITRMTSPAQPRFREVVDSNGSVYRIGETDRDILGRSRAWMVWLPWAGVMAISVYGYGSAAKSLREAHGWSRSQTFWLLSIPAGDGIDEFGVTRPTSPSLRSARWAASTTAPDGRPTR
jgi:CoA-transferase family III